jgi:hypothetical protein
MLRRESVADPPDKPEAVGATSQADAAVVGPLAQAEAGNGQAGPASAVPLDSRLAAWAAAAKVLVAAQSSWSRLRPMTCRPACRKSATHR